jgi:steroid delta-isomerase-like uncharacterized protein
MEPMETILAWEKAWNSRDFEKASSYLAEDYVLENVATGVSTRGRAEFAAYMDSLLQAFPDLKFENKGVIVSGNKAASEYVVSGTQKNEFRGMPATGKSFAMKCCSICEFKEGLYARETMYTDTATMMRQLGHIPSPG